MISSKSFNITLGSLSGAVLLVFGASICLAGSQPPARWTMDDVCVGRADFIRSVEELQSLQVNIKTANGFADCQDKFEAVDAVQKLLELNSKGAMCGQEAARIISYIYSTHVGHFTSEMPHSIVVFSKRLSLEISAECKRSLVKELSHFDNLLQGDQLARVERLEKSGAFLLANHAATKEHADILVLAAELVRAVRSGRDKANKVIPKLDSKTREFLTEFRHDCVHSYRPLYQQSLATIINIAIYGFDYTLSRSIPEELEERNKLNENCNLRRWLNIMTTCELLRNVESLKGSHTELEPYDKIHGQWQLKGSVSNELKIDHIQGGYKAARKSAKKALEEASKWRKEIFADLAGEKKHKLTDILAKSDRKLVAKMLENMDKCLAKH